MKLEKAVKCKHCNRKQRGFVNYTPTHEYLFWSRCEYCNKFGLYIQETTSMSPWEFIIRFYKYFGVRGFSGRI